MNYSAIDLDIDHYNNQDLERFFNLGKNYSEHDITSKEIDIRKKLLGNISDKSFQNRLFMFLDEAKRILFQNINKITLEPGDGTNFVIQKSKDSIMNHVDPLNTFLTDTAPGSLNKLRRRTRLMSLSMNTLFRDDTSISSSDCFFTLTYTLKNVVGIRLLSIELPESIYLISNKLMSNWLYIWVPATDISGNIFIPEGCYDASVLELTLENAINNTLGVTDFTVLIDPISKRTTISHNLGYSFELSLFNPDSDVCRTTKFEQSLGWILGYRCSLYSNSDSYTSEGLFFEAPLEYLFFSLNDYNYNNSSTVVAQLYENYIEENILAKIPYNNNNFKILFDGSSDVISPHRQFFGPVDIKKFAMKLLNKFGQVVDINFMDFSFTLEVEMIYDI
jgi:hypothetical protein|uniref:Uncharacterized protein n=1 Tax=viral metagenome TaxID=1070528 RepID=A0A6C0DTR9_9ZZZZ